MGAWFPLTNIPDDSIHAPKSDNPSPSEGLRCMTTDDTLRQKLTELRRRRDTHHIDESDYIDEVLALIHQDRHALLLNLKKQLHGGEMGMVSALSVGNIIDAEIQRLTGLEESEADHE